MSCRLRHRLRQLPSGLGCIDRQPGLEGVECLLERLELRAELVRHAAAARRERRREGSERKLDGSVVA